MFGNYYNKTCIILEGNLGNSKFRVDINIPSVVRTVTKAVIRSRNSKERQYNDQTKKDKGTSNDLQNTTQKIKYRATRTPLTTGDERR
jgi:hypothetical protein